MLKTLFFLVLSLLSLEAKEVHFVSSFNIEELPSNFKQLKKYFTVKNVCPSDYFVSISPHDPEIKKIIIFDPFFNQVVIPKLPFRKLILFEWEPQLFSLDFYSPYSKVYTWNDALVDNVKFFRFNYPYLTEQVPNLPSFISRKFCTMVVGNWTNPRLEILKFFNEIEGFEFYGRCPMGFENSPRYLGHIPGQHTGPEKIKTLSSYRFCICFENTIGLQGYITEKIFSCFAAGTIPVYWGAKNIEAYIPKSCFIDYNDFQSPGLLFDYLKSMNESTYQQYLNCISDFLKSEQGHAFSGDYFDELLLEAAMSK